jgi:hypothetical protein
MQHAIRGSEASSLYCEVYELETVESGIRFPERGSDSSPFHCFPTGTGAQAAYYPVHAEGCSYGVKATGA